jgi:hypothetical protein
MAISDDASWCEEQRIPLSRELSHDAEVLYVRTHSSDS